MREKIDNALWKMMYTVNEKFLRDEKGDSNMVAVIVLIVIILAVAGIFRKSLMDAIQAIMDQFMDFIEG